jgi:hypothetical protein
LREIEAYAGSEEKEHEYFGGAGFRNGSLPNACVFLAALTVGELPASHSVMDDAFSRRANGDCRVH